MLCGSPIFPVILVKLFGLISKTFKILPAVRNAFVPMTANHLDAVADHLDEGVRVNLL